MSPNKIFRILDSAVIARKQGRILNPLFTGEAGLGKSFVCQQWMRAQKERNPNFGFFDFRAAYYEGPDVIGYPNIQVDANGRSRTYQNLPIFWPTEGEGLLLIEEPNRGNQSIMNCLMQLLTDRKIGEYKLPEGWIIASCINPENGSYDVNTMDQALRNRFIPYEVTFDLKTFLDYVKTEEWHSNVRNFLISDMWTYKKSEDIGTNGYYISPRTWEQINTLEFVMEELKADQSEHSDNAIATLGYDIGKAYHSFVYDQSPVLAKDLKENKEKAIEKLKTQVQRNSYKGDLIAATVTSIIDAMPDFPFDTMLEVMRVIPADQAVVLIEQHCMKDPDENYNLPLLRKNHPEIDVIIKTGLARSKALDVPETEKATKKAKK